MREEHLLNSETKEFERFSVEIFSRGKTPTHNEDSWVATDDTLAVIDGATPKTNDSFDGKTGGEFASQLARSVIQSETNLVGEALVNLLTARFNESFSRIGVSQLVETNPTARPTAVLTVARIVGDKMIITQVSDVSFRINATQVYTSPLAIDEVMAQKRTEAIKRAQQRNSNMSADKFLAIGREAILDTLGSQVRQYQNNPEHPFGYGAIDGWPVPKKFIKIFSFDLKDIQTLEIFSDGYFKVADEPIISSWEQAFMDVEEEDPYKIGRFASTKGSSKDSFTDDRTILIARIQ